MPNAEMKTLTIGDTTYEIVDEEAREKEGDLSELNTQVQTDLVAAINEVADSSGVVTVNGMTGTVVLTAADVGAATTGALTDEATARTAADAQLQGQITALGNGAPIPVSTIAAMTVQTQVYLYTGTETGESTGYWYTYDSTQAKFVPRGEYGGAVTDTTLSISGKAADAKAVGDALAEKADVDDMTAVEGDVSDLKSDIGLVTPDSVETGYYISTTGVKSQDSNFKIEKYVIDPTLDYYIAGGASGYITIVSSWDTSFTTLDTMILKSTHVSNLTTVKINYVSDTAVGIAICSRTNESVLVYANANVQSIKTQLVDEVKARTTADASEQQARIATDGKITADDGLGLYVQDVSYTGIENNYYYNSSCVKSAINGWSIYSFTLAKGLYKYEIHSLANGGVGAVVLNTGGTLSLVTVGVSNNSVVKENTGYIKAEDDCICYVTQKTDEVVPVITAVKFDVNAFEPVYSSDSTLSATYISKSGVATSASGWITYVFNITSNKVYRAIVNTIGGAVASIISVANSDLTKIKPLKIGNALTTPTVHDEYIVANDQYTKVLLSFPNDSKTKYFMLLDAYDLFYEVTQDNKYFAITNNTDNTQQDKEDLSNLTGKTWNAVGDSITAQGLYITPVETELGIDATNRGVASSTIAVNDTYMTGKSIVERVCGLNGNTAYPDADIWTVMGGLNDKLYNSPLGDINSTSISTVYGALKAICDNIRKRENNPLLILVTPTQSNRNSEYMFKLRQAVIDVALLYACPVIDAYAYGGVNPANLYNATSDGVHLNAVGTAFLYPLFVSAIKEYS